MTTPLRIALRHGVIFATMDVPETRNALSPEMVAGLHDAVRAAARCRALVLRGAGGVFSAGGSFTSFRTRIEGGDASMAPNRRFGDLLEALLNLPTPVIAAVDGVVLGGAMGLVGVADIALGTAASRFGLPETSLGLIPAQVGPFLLPRLGVVAARRLAITGERVDAEEARRIGLLDLVVEDAAALDAALARQLDMILRNAPDATVVTKTYLGRALREPLPEVRARGAQLFADALAGEGREGMAARAEKRAPSWARGFGVEDLP